MFKIRGARLLWGLVLLMVVALLALAAACSSSDGDGDDGETPEAGETPAADAGDEGDGGGDEDDGGGDLDALAAAAQGVGFENLKATYLVTTPAAGGVFSSPGTPSVALGTATESTMVIAERAPADFRFEIISSENNQTIKTIIIQTTDSGVAAPGAFFGTTVTYLCNEGSGEQSCFVIEGGESAQYTSLLTVLTDTPQQVVQASGAFVNSVDTENIGGLMSTCYTVDAPNLASFSPGDPVSALAALGGPTAQICFADEGGLLTRMNSPGGNFELQSVTQATDEDFMPPYEVVDPFEGFEIPDLELTQ